MTALDIRQALATVLTTTTQAGTGDNPVTTTHFFHPDQIPFEATPALILTCPDEDEHFTTLSASHSESTVTVEVEYLDAPITGDDLQEQMAAVEAWFEQAKVNLRHNSRGIISGNAYWAFTKRIRTKIDKPLVDQGRVFYHGCLYVTVLANLHP
jgi:hypothetical protein